MHADITTARTFNVGDAVLLHGRGNNPQERFPGTVVGTKVGWQGDTFYIVQVGQGPTVTACAGELDPRDARPPHECDDDCGCDYAPGTGDDREPVMGRCVTVRA